MRLVLGDSLVELRSNLFPLTLGRPLWELRVGMTSLAEKLGAKIQPDDTAYFVPDYMAEVYRAQVGKPANDMAALAGYDLILVNPVVKAENLKVLAKGPSEVGLDERGMVIYARISKDDVKRLASDDIEQFIASAREKLPNVSCKRPVWNYTWDLVLANSAQITAEFAAAGRNGFEGSLEEPVAIRGSRKDVYVAPGVKVHPMVTIDAEHGPVYIDQGAEILSFTRIEGPCYIGKDSILLGANCREGNSIGPCCRIGGEVEESIIHGYSNKYHDGFLGHSYVGEWVNLGALTTNSDLKHVYSNVSVLLHGRRSIDTGSPKVG